jgi:uncharacterized membrane protein YqjE
MDTPRAPLTAGLTIHLRRLAEHALALISVRLELLSLEIEEERGRFGRLLIFAVCAFFLIGFGTLALALLLTVMWWDSHRLLALTILTSFFLGGGLVCAIASWRVAQCGSRLFAASLGALASDRQALSPDGKAK